MRAVMLPVVALLTALGCESSHDTRGVVADSAAATRVAQAADSIVPEASDTLWLFASEPAGDAVRATDTEETLRARYGADNVARERIQLGEGETSPGTVLFPQDSMRRLRIMWKDTLARTQPERVWVDARASRWFVFPGVTMGTSLTALEKMNGGPFDLHGFAWDYGGTVGNWNGGRLDSLWHSAPNARSVWVRLSPDFDAPGAGPLLGQVSGEKLFSSATPAMRALDPVVYDLSVEPR